MSNMIVVKLKCIKVIGSYFSFIKINFLYSPFINGNFGIKKKIEKEVTKDVICRIQSNQIFVQKV